MSAELDTVKRFYEAFSRRDAASMAACYAPDVRFSDPVFTDLRGRTAPAMWAMLCEGGRDLEVRLVRAEEKGDRVEARWEAFYTFSQTGRRVHNVIDASFRFRDGRIVEHDDRFDFWRWSRQALGPAGLALGWTPLVRNAVRSRAAKALSTFEQRWTAPAGF